MYEEKIKKHIFKVMIIFFGLFIILILHITYLQTFGAPALSGHPLNRREDGAWERGRILDVKGVVLAEERRAGDGKPARVYAQGRLFVHVTGYYDRQFGRTGIESICDDDLSGRSSFWRRLGAISRLLDRRRGSDVRLTIDAEVQRAADQALGSRRGAIVVLEPKTGAVLAMVSKPAFDPNALEDNWDALRADLDSPLLNRATQGLYPPGSIFKTLTADAALGAGIADSRQVFDCPGQLVIGDYVLPESHGAVHGKVDLEEALAVSCNVTFGSLALRLGNDEMKKAMERFGLAKPLDGEFEESLPRLPDFAKIGDGERAQVGIGQGTLLVTPLRMALLESAFVNGGVIMKPRLVDAVLSADGAVFRRSAPEKWLEATTPQRAALLKGFMRAAVEGGTAARAAVSGIDVTGKTGTAENAAGETHAWFIGSAALSGREVVFAVIVENGGGGGTDAAPIVRKIIVNSLMN